MAPIFRHVVRWTQYWTHAVGHLTALRVEIYRRGDKLVAIKCYGVEIYANVRNSPLQNQTYFFTNNSC
jgi:hypothetical protein